MTVLWTTTELPAADWDPKPDDTPDNLPRDLWGQGITAHAANNATVIQPPARYL